MIRRIWHAERLSNGNTLITEYSNYRVIEVDSGGTIVWEYTILGFPWDAERISISPDAPTIDGPTHGKAGKAYPYTFTSIDPNGDEVSYYIEWGDGNTTSWTEFRPSGSPGYSESHSWDTQGTFIIQAKTKDINGDESNWSEFEVTIPRNRATFNSLFYWLLERFPLLESLLYWFR